MTELGVATRLLRRVRREVSDLQRAHAVMWENLGRIDPDPGPYLHWEPSTSGWRLHGSLVPPEAADAPPDQMG